MAKKTPIVDQIHQKLKLVEKIQSDMPFANKMDTGIDTDSRTAVWRATHKKFEDALGLQGIRDTFGQRDANVINVPAERSMKDKDIDREVSKALFGSDAIKDKRIDLLTVREYQVGLEPKTEDTDGNYVWRTSRLQPLNEAGPISFSQLDTDFWRVDNTDVVFTRREKGLFSNCFYAVVPKSPKLGSFLHNAYGVMPKGGVNDVRAVQNYATLNYKEAVHAAIDIVKGFTKDTENQEMLDRLKTLDFDTLPIVIHDSVMVGVLDAANTGTKGLNESLTISENKIGWQLLEPISALSSLQSIIYATSKGEESLELSPELNSKIAESLHSVSGAKSTYDEHFLAALKEAIKKKKFNVLNLMVNL